MTGLSLPGTWVRSVANLPLISFLPVAYGILAFNSDAESQDGIAVTLPQGVRAVWNIEKAVHETTPSRKRVCINGLWRWQPAADNAIEVPTAAWGYFKVPACWPGI